MQRTRSYLASALPGLAGASLLFWVLSAGVGRPALALAVFMTAVLMIGVWRIRTVGAAVGPVPGWYLLGGFALFQYFLFFGGIAALSPPPDTSEFVQRADKLSFWLIGACLRA